MNIKILFITVIISFFTTSISAKNVCTAESFEGLNVYIEKSFTIKNEAKKQYEKKIKEFNEYIIKLFSKTGSTVDDLKNYYVHADPAVLMALRLQEDFTKKWSYDLGFIGANISSCISRLKKVSNTLNKLHSSCKKYGHTEGIIASETNIKVVKENLKGCEYLNERYDHVKKQVDEEFKFLHDARIRAEKEKDWSENK